VKDFDWYVLPPMLRCVLMMGVRGEALHNDLQWVEHHATKMHFALTVLLSLGLITKSTDDRHGTKWKYSETFLGLCRRRQNKFYAHREIAIRASAHGFDEPLEHEEE
jgi:hypothetical protein